MIATFPLPLGLAALALVGALVLLIAWAEWRDRRRAAGKPE